ncbi:hypothetical protein MTP99_015755 [Tenebrio molitor]|nr:hypothetical protein MTP99_015755 [Tenebrio molitor]
MVRNFKKKTKRGEISQQRFERAYADIKEGILSLREAARTYEIDKMTLFRYKKKKETNPELKEGEKKLDKSLGLENQEVSKNNSGKTNKGKNIDKESQKKKKRAPRHVGKDDETSTEEDCLCLMCLEPYSASKPGAKWIKCILCGKWAHLDCGYDSLTYMCINCESGEEGSEDEEK